MSALIEKVAEALKASIAVELNELISFISPSIGKLSFVAEGSGYYAIKIAPVIFKALTGESVGCYSSRGYARYIAPYTEEDAAVFISGGGEIVNPRILEAMETCNILGIKTAAIIMGRDDSGEIIDSVDLAIEIDAPKDNLSITHYLAAMAFLTKMAGEIGERRGSGRAIELKKELEHFIGEVENMNHKNEVVETLVLRASEKPRSFIYAGPILWGVAMKLSRDLNAYFKAGSIPIDLSQHPHFTKCISDEDIAIVLKTEIEIEAAREVINSLKLRGIEVHEVEVGGDPFLAPLIAGTAIFTTLRELISERKITIPPEIW